MRRRKFLELSTMGSAALISSFYMPLKAADRKLNIGLIGCGWYGMVISTAALKNGGVEVKGICDVDSEHLASSANELEKLQGSRPKTFKEYRDLLDMKGLDVIFIGTQPHWHALQFIAACEKGYDIYCEKPLSYDVMEGLAMINAAKKAGNIVQIGFQRRQSEAFKKVKELIMNGTAGNIHQIAAQINYNPVMLDNTVQAPPASLDWEEWCGPAPKLDYRPNIGHKAWRLEKEYGNGHLVDWGIHHVDIIRKIMDEDMPVRFQSTGGLFELAGEITTPDTLNVNMMFQKAPLNWQHRLWGTGDIHKAYNNGIYFYGDKATIFATDTKVELLKTGKDEKPESMQFQGDTMQGNHVGEFLDAVRAKNAKMISCPVADAFQSTATVQLAMISYYTNSQVEWNENNHEILRNPVASKLLRRDYRGNYIHP